jgi:hypothetical protein
LSIGDVLGDVDAGVGTVRGPAIDSEDTGRPAQILAWPSRVVVAISLDTRGDVSAGRAPGAAWTCTARMNGVARGLAVPYGGCRPATSRRRMRQ